MKNVSSARHLVACVIVLGTLLIPVRLSAGVGDIVSLLMTITSTLKNQVSQALNGIQTINTNIRTLEQQVVWPLSLIDQTRTSVTQVRAQLSSVASGIHALPADSATLVNPSRLETLLRNPQTNNFDGISASYTQIYRPVPEPDQATETLRNLMDADDALAVGALKSATVSEQASAQMLIVADRLEQEAAASAPGSAGILSAQAQVANLQGQALLHRMLATDLRQEATKLAHANALRRQSANATMNLRRNMQQILSR